MVVAFVMRGRLRERRIGSQVQRLVASGRATVTCRVRGDDRYPGRWEACRLVIDPDGAVLRLRERHLPDVRLPAGRVEVLHVRAAGRSEPGRRDVEDLVVLYSADDPQRARLVGEGDGTGRGMLLSGLLGGGGLPWVAWCLHGAAVARREVLGALRDERRTHLDYVLTADPTGDPVLLLWTPGATTPGWAVPLAEPLLGAIPVRGTVQVRGVLGDDRPLVPVLPDRVLWPASRAVEVDRELALVLISGELSDDELPEENDPDLSPT